MEKKIAKTVKGLRIQFYLLWIFPVLLAVLFETDLLPVGIYADEAGVQFVLENIGILATIISVPLSLKIFSIMLRRNSSELSFLAALNRYKLWSGIRLGILGIVAVYNITVYYFTLNSAGALCALIVLAASLFCYPNEKRMRVELHIDDDEQ